VFYEDLKRDLPAGVRHIAEFICRTGNNRHSTWKPRRLTEGSVAWIAHQASLSEMRKNPFANCRSVFVESLHLGAVSRNL